jgi:hypothetical protein
MNAPDPRFRPFRAVAWAFYLVVAVGFSSLIIFSVFKSVFQMTPDRQRPSPDVLTVTQCVNGAKAMFAELEQERANHAEPSSTAADRRFLEFRIDWLSRKRRLESECAIDAPDRTALKAALATLDHVLDLYTTASVQFASGVAPSVERLRAELDRAAPTP